MDDKLFEHIKHRFEESRTDLGWNDPTDDLFDKAMVTVQGLEQKKKKRGGLLFLPCLILVTILLFNLYGKEDIEETSVQNQYTEAISSRTHDVNFLPKNKVAEAAINRIELKKEFPLKEVNSKQKSSSRASVSFNEVSNAFSSSRQRAINHIENNSETPDHNGISGVSPLEPRFSILSFERRIKPVFLNLDLTNNEAEAAPRTSYGMYLSAGANMSRLNMVSDFLPEFELHGYDNYYSGFNIELGGIIRTKEKLEFRTFLGYSDINNSSVYNKSEPHNSQNFTVHNNGNVQYQLSEIMTPIGMVDPGVDLSMDSRMTTNSDMYQHALIDQKITILKIGTGIGYRLFDVKGFNVGLLTDVTFNRVSRVNTDASFYLMDDSEHMMGESYFNGSNVSGMSNNFFSFSVGMNFEYAIDNNSSISLNIRRDRSLTNLLVSEKVSTSINTVNSSIGFIKYFN